MSILLRRFKLLSLKKKLALIIGVFIVFIIISQIIGNLTKPPGYTTKKAKLSSIVEKVTESGNISTNGKIDVFSPTNGFVTDVLVKNGDLVKEGDILFKVESAATQQESQQAYSNYLAAVSTLNSAQSTSNTLRAGMYTEWESFRNLATNSTYENSNDTPNVDNRKAAEFQIAQDTWAAAEKKYKDQENAIAQARALVNSTNILYLATKDAVVKAQRDGIVTNLSITKGSNVTIPNPALGTVRPVLVLSQDTDLEIMLELSETDILKINPGQKATVTVSAVNDKQYQGIVDRVDSIGTDTLGVVTYNAYIRLKNADDTLRPGMTVDADIITKELKNVLSVPNSSVKPYQGGKAVRIPDKKFKEGFKYIPVIIGIRGEKETQILKGLQEGQEVIDSLSNENVKRPGLLGG